MRPGRRARAAAVVVALALAGSPAAAQEGPPPGGSPAASPGALSPDSAHPGRHLRVFLLSAGRGDIVWEKFGHNALRIVDEARGTDVTWEWGIFDFSQENFWPRLITGRMLYSMGRSETGDMLYRYDYFDRPVWQQELALTPDQKLRLQRAVHENWEPANREYLYDYYRDNCSTRIRDHLDAALGGALSAALVGDTTGATYRWHTRRLLSDALPAYAGIQLVLGNRADRPITEWEEGFLPLRLQAYLREVTVTGEDGRPRPLVRHERLILPSSRERAPVDVPDRLGWAAGLGLLVGGVLLGLAAWAERGSRVGRALFAAVAAGWSAVVGVAGTVLLGAWLFTEHWFWAMNENVLQASPLHLVLAAAVVPLLWRRAPGRTAVVLAVAAAALSCLGFLVQPLPGLDQVNGEIIALALPAHAALALALARLRPGAPASADRAAAAAGRAA